MDSLLSMGNSFRMFDVSRFSCYSSMSVQMTRPVKLNLVGGEMRWEFNVYTREKERLGSAGVVLDIARTNCISVPLFTDTSSGARVQAMWIYSRGLLYDLSFLRKHAVRSIGSDIVIHFEGFQIELGNDIIITLDMEIEPILVNS